MKKFVNFLKTLKNGDNSHLLETIETGFNFIFEAPSTDDANKHPQTAGTVGPPANAVSFDPNEGEEWFPKTLPDKKLGQVQAAQSVGHGDKLYPGVGTGAITLDPNKSGQGRSDNANKGSPDSGASELSGEYAGDSGGYNLGGPT